MLGNVLVIIILSSIEVKRIANDYKKTDKIFQCLSKGET